MNIAIKKQLLYSYKYILLFLLNSHKLHLLSLK